MHITLSVPYNVPSLNATKRQHWGKQHAEQKEAFRALSSALLATGRDLSTQITSPEVAKTCLMAADTLGLYLATSHGASASKLSKSKSFISPTSGQ
jgi:hypothetical protein